MHTVVLKVEEEEEAAVGTACTACTACVVVAADTMYTVWVVVADIVYNAPVTVTADIVYTALVTVTADTVAMEVVASTEDVSVHAGSQEEENEAIQVNTHSRVMVDETHFGACVSSNDNLTNPAHPAPLPPRLQRPPISTIWNLMQVVVLSNKYHHTWHR